MNEVLYGVAYYDEYMPYDRLDKDVAMMKAAGINVVRIAESTWSTMEPRDGEFDFSHIDRVLDAMGNAGIHVIVGTPTYAVPAWLVKKYPDVLAVTHNGPGRYGHRQIMDITNKAYLYYSERAIRKMMEHIKDHPAIIGYQIDNETKPYDTCGENVQRDFVQYLKEKFDGDIEKMNQAFGLNYWSNAIHDWEDFPDVRGTINGSLGCEFEKFQRSLVVKFFEWQRAILMEYKKDDQFITHNLDYGWKGHSYGIQPGVNHFHLADTLDICGCDIYHPSQDKLTGKEVAFGGDLIRSLKNQNYLVLETQAQGFPEWTPYDGQLRQLAFSHFASGADMVEYWHWHSIHNAIETYWKGLVSHDFSESKTYNEAKTVGNDLKRIGDKILHLKKNNKIAILVSNESLTALQWFTMGGSVDYNDVMRWLFDAAYEMNYECDFIWPESENLRDYKVIILPALYSAPQDTIDRLKEYVYNGGTLIGTFKSCFTDENVKVYADAQPHTLRECFGITYDQFTMAGDSTYVKNTGNIYGYVPDGRKVNALGFMECLKLEGAEGLLSYDHDNWGQYTAVSRNKFGDGTAYYIGTMFSSEVLKNILREAFTNAGVENNKGSEGFPVIIRKGINQYGKQITYIFNYSMTEQTAICPSYATDILTGEDYKQGDIITLNKWGFVILES